MKVKIRDLKPGDFFKSGNDIFFRFAPKINERRTGLGNVVNCVWITPALGDPQQTCNFCPDLDGDIVVEKLTATFTPAKKRDK